MMNPIKTRISIFAAALLAGVSILAVPSNAHAEPGYPPFLQAALEKQPQLAGVKICIPQCTACHNTSEGGINNLNPFGTNLYTAADKGGGGLKIGSMEAGVQAAVTTYLMTNPDSDKDGVSDIDEIKQGDAPGVAGPRGQSQFCPDIKYGCAGGRIAAAPARNDKPAFFAAALVAVGLSAAMRRRGRRAPRAS